MRQEPLDHILGTPVTTASITALAEISPSLNRNQLQIQSWFRKWKQGFHICWSKLTKTILAQRNIF